MPDAETLVRMYGPAYADSGAADASVEDPRAPEELLVRLRTLPPGLFVDFGCGSGSLLAAARDLGWAATGVEFDPEVVRKASVQAQCPVLTGLDALPTSAAVPADVIHLGDVLEHLTAPLDVLQTLVGLLRPTGRLVAQGPLEAAPACSRLSSAPRGASAVHPPWRCLPITSYRRPWRVSGGCSKERG